MSFLKTARVQLTSSAAAPGSVSVPAELRKGLGFFSQFAVNRAESRAKKSATITLTEASVEATTDVALTAIDQQRTLLKTGLVTRAINEYAAIATECQARAAVTHEQISGIHTEGLARIVDIRHSNLQGISLRVAQGKLSEAEGEELVEYQKQLAADDVLRIGRNVARAKDAVDSLVERATDHIANAKSK